MTSIEDHPTVEERLDRLSAQVEEMAGELRGQRESRRRWEELAAAVSSLGGPAIGKLTDALSEAERRGYFVVVRGGATIVDRAVTTLRDSPPEDARPPSTLTLLRALRDPATRRGVARTLALVRAVGAAPPAHASAPTTRG